MVDFVGRTTSTVDEATKWGNYFGGIDERAHQRWTMEEQRRRYDEANRYNRAEAQSAGDFYAQNAGLVNGTNGELAGLRPLGRGPIAPTASSRPAAATGGPISLQPPSAAPAAAPAATPAAAPTVQAGSATEDNPRVLTPNQGVDPSSPTENWVPVRQSELTPEQRRAVSAWNAAFNGGVGSRARVESTRNRMEALGIRVNMDGTLVRRAPQGATAPGGLSGLPEQFDISQYDESRSVPSADPRADLQPEAAAGVSTPNSMATDPYMQYASEDTSRPLQPTYEMQLIDVSNRNAMRRAQLAAQHGRNDIADQSFNMVLQGLAANRQQENLVLLRAAADGSERAASALIARFHGYPPGTVEIRSTGEQPPRFVMQVRGEDGQMRTATNGTPMTRTDLISRLQTLADRETAAANAEVAAENERSIREWGTRFQIATLEAQTRVYQTMSDVEIARARMVTDRLNAMGAHTQMVTTEDGGIALRYESVGPDGQPQQNIEWIRTEDLPTANVDGNRNQTTPQMVRSRVTGTVGAGAQ